MLATGLRLSSATALDTDDVDLERAEIEVRSTKGNRPDRVLLGTTILEHLTENLATAQLAGDWPTALSRQFRSSSVNKKIALSWSPHRKKSVQSSRAGVDKVVGSRCTGYSFYALPRRSCESTGHPLQHDRHGKLDESSYR